MKIITKNEAETLSVRLRTPVKDISANLGSVYGEIAGLFGTDGINCTGSPFVIYYNMDMDDLDIEAGFPVSGALKDYGRVKKSMLPGGKQLSLQYKGPYDNIGEAYDKMNAYCKENNLKPQEKVYEEYLNDPGDTEPKDLLTNIYFLLD